ncbi:hypothetical protein SIN8267_03196 [Sinobacterium norvegicum]|uniref:Metallo-beta-lactamase domain-containing protein n=1 Tax=Sinobacterium norvegicum TaxID=1641715 RepID=A0ABM9AIN3_9GAMM|nr:MBL fold metallo-hydrolase [Sinobacterium norvegicum]CAH0993057.1 hypothetical protein SIN8267_03196 [Sinobacterium norvegicum]
MSSFPVKMIATITASVAVGIGVGLLFGNETTQRVIEERKAEIVGGLADSYMASNTEANEEGGVKTVSGLHHIEIEVDTFGNNIYRAKGVANSFLVATSEGNVIFDAGLATQGAKQKRLLQEAAPGELKYIVLSHSHQDHIGATNFWRNEYPDAKIITHRNFIEGQRYLKDLENYFWGRNRLLYTFMPEHPPEAGSIFAFGDIVPDITIADGDEYRFTLGDTEFLVLPTPGAEGEDNIVMWVENEQALFTGDVFGPLFPMVPNLFTLRGEKFRDPIKYINSLDTMIALKPELILPSHFDPIVGEEQLQQDLYAMREVTRYIHDETVAGMNAGKSLWQLMEEIQLPEELGLTQGHGKVSWNVRSIWENYSTWFHFESTTELYPVPTREVYVDVAELAGGSDKLLARAGQKLAQQEPVKALHLVEMAEGGSGSTAESEAVRLAALQQLLENAYKTGSNFSETGWLKSRIAITEAKLAQQ